MPVMPEWHLSKSTIRIFLSNWGATMNPEKLGQGVKFERIRRITGYLVGTMDKWNNAKKAEERDRVVHMSSKTASDGHAP